MDEERTPRTTGSGVSVVIPTRQEAARLPGLLDRLRSQSAPPDEIVVVDSSSEDGTADLARAAGAVVEVIPRTSFNHGGTRNLGAEIASGRILVFMTADALPANERFLEALARPVRESTAAAATARQLPTEDATPLERFSRAFLYPSRSRTQSRDDFARLDVRAFHFSDVAAAIDRDAFEAVGRYPDRVIMSEDKMLSAKLLAAGFRVMYVAEAEVVHSHRYSLADQWKRYFDVGASYSQFPLLANVATGGEGLRFASGQIKFLARERAWGWIPRSLTESIVKFVAFETGKRERYLPPALKRRLSLYSVFWESPGGTGRAAA